VALQGAGDEALFVFLGASAVACSFLIVLTRGIYSGQQLNRWTAGTSTFIYLRKMRRPGNWSLCRDRQRTRIIRGWVTVVIERKLDKLDIAGLDWTLYCVRIGTI
jgi:hypothetical protein